MSLFCPEDLVAGNDILEKKQRQMSQRAYRWPLFINSDYTTSTFIGSNQPNQPKLINSEFAYFHFEKSMVTIGASRVSLSPRNQILTQAWGAFLVCNMKVGGAPVSSRAASRPAVSTWPRCCQPRRAGQRVAEAIVRWVPREAELVELGSKL